jgi:quercetin dioxygenase-like cupin family protein
VTVEPVLHYIEGEGKHMIEASARKIVVGTDRFGEHRGLGISTIDFKLSPQDAEGLFILENTFRAKGGPAKHLHHSQDEWFYCLEGKFIFEVGGQTYSLEPGDSLLAPMRVPHVWAHVGEGFGRILVAFAPAGRMEAFFREVTKTDSMPAQDPELWRSYGMELIGPPMSVTQG